jgi:hypothetical protein
MRGKNSPMLVDAAIVYVDGTVCWGCIWGIRMGFALGITLDDHPLLRAESLLAGAVRGSAGIPDSPTRKPVATSGRTVRVRLHPRDHVLISPTVPLASHRFAS